MQLRTFSATTATEVITQIKTELGSDAVIIDTQEENGVITMTAALERSQSVNAHRPADSQNSYRAFDTFSPNPANALSAESEVEDWKKEWASIRAHLLALMKPALRLDLLAPRQRLALEFLQKERVNDEATLSLFQELKKNPELSILTPLEMLVPTLSWSATNWPQQIHFITGPFGSGKTTSTIRMALHIKKHAPKLRLCIINADATRGNGRLLLRHYCELSDLAYKEATNTLELVAATAIAEREGYDKILIDLPGLSRGKFLHTLLQDAGFLSSDKESAAVHLTLPPYLSDEENRQVISRYKTPFASSLVWTKLDESEHFGSIVNVPCFNKLPVSALSFGPGLGNSLVPVTERMLWRLLFKRELPTSC